MRDLKSTYRTHLWIFTGINTLVFWYVVVQAESISSIATLTEAISWTDGFMGLVAPIVTLILSGWLPADLKAKLIFWRIRHPLPGSFAFSKYLNKDPRIDVVALESKLGELPSEPDQQNRLWFRLMKDVESDVAIEQSNRSWLFARDLSGYSVIFLVVFGLPSLFLSDIGGYYILLLLLQYLALIVAARNYGIRFVTNVLAKTSHE